MTQSWLRWLPAYSTTSFIGLMLLSVAIAVCVRMIWGRGLIGGHWVIWLLRCASISLVIAILFGPTQVEQTAPLISRPKMLFLFDGSSSMKLGAETSRWQDALAFVESGMEKTRNEAGSDCQSYRFGHRLGPLSPTIDLSSTTGSAATNGKLPTVRSSRAVLSSPSIPEPEATDTRLADALRELSSRIDPRNTAGVVLLSDGRVRGSESVEQLASLMGKRNVPIHVVPVGSSTGTGDVAIISMVTQPNVRKYSENEIQVFLRSFGMAGRNTTVRILDADAPAGSAPAISSVPIVLTGNAQSVSLVYNIADQPHHFKIVVDPLDGELTNRNNEINVNINIDRTRVRVLYVEGNSSVRGMFTQLVQDAFGIARPITNEGFSVGSALREDIDIECNVFESPNGDQPPRRVVDSSGATATTSFPESRSELFSYDCIVFSNVGPDILETNQQEMILQWLEGRGAGMIITGSDAILKEKWRDSPLLRALPIVIDSAQSSSDESLKFKIKNRLHPIWKLLNESGANDRLLDSIPELRFSVRGTKVKPGAELLATLEESGDPMIVGQRFGRGRVLLSVPALGGAAGASLHTDWGPQGRKSASKLWRNMVYWATEGSSIGRRRITVEADKRFYRPGDSMTFKAIAYDDSARRSTNYRVLSLFEPLSIEEASTYSPALWPEGVRRESGESSPRIPWGEEIPFQKLPSGDAYGLTLSLNEAMDGSQGGLRMELTAYEGEDGTSDKAAGGQSFGHGTQVDSMSTELHVLSDPFEQQNPLPNHDLLVRIAKLSGGKVLGRPEELAELLQTRRTIELESIQSQEPAWSGWWLCCTLGILLTSEWIVRRLSGFA